MAELPIDFWPMALGSAIVIWPLCLLIERLLLGWFLKNYFVKAVISAVLVGGLMIAAAKARSNHLQKVDYDDLGLLLAQLAACVLLPIVRSIAKLIRPTKDAIQPAPPR